MLVFALVLASGVFAYMLGFQQGEHATERQSIMRLKNMSDVLGHKLEAINADTELSPETVCEAPYAQMPGTTSQVKDAVIPR